MAIQLLRGHVREVAAPDKRGAVDCQLGKSNVKVHADLVSSIGKGDDVLLACEQRSGAYRALAVRNIDQGKTSQIDPTNNILLLVAGGFLFILGLGLDLDFEINGVIAQTLEMTMGLIGLLGIGISLRSLLLITRAGTLVRYADL